jgi:hypothetical protein
MTFHLDKCSELPARQLWPLIGFRLGKSAKPDKGIPNAIWIFVSLQYFDGLVRQALKLLRSVYWKRFLLSLTKAYPQAPE